ncbi:ubiquitin-like protein Pup homolog [Streptomyces sp. NBRC 110611]|nr:ubiquitin-like protein Pup homolog [Streptomyces sp. NBRC 110611]
MRSQGVGTKREREKPWSRGDAVGVAFQQRLGEQGGLRPGAGAAALVAADGCDHSPAGFEPATPALGVSPGRGCDL